MRAQYVVDQHIRNAKQYSGNAGKKARTSLASGSPPLSNKNCAIRKFPVLHANSKAVIPESGCNRIQARTHWSCIQEQKQGHNFQESITKRRSESCGCGSRTAQNHSSTQGYVLNTNLNKIYKRTALHQHTGDVGRARQQAATHERRHSPLYKAKTSSDEIDRP